MITFVVGRIVLVASSVLLVLFGLSLSTMAIDREHYRARALQAIEDGSLSREAFLPFADNRQSLYGYNDCLILGMNVLEPQGSMVQNATSPLRLRWPRLTAEDRAAPMPPERYCAGLRRALHDPKQNLGYYHRYIHGDWVLSSTLLAVLSFSLASLFLFILTMLLPITLILVSATRLFRGSPQSPRDSAFLAIGVGLAIFYGLPVFGWSFSFAPSDIVILGFVLLAYWRPLSSLDHRLLVTLTALLGALMASFEFLTGALPLGLSVLLGMFALEENQDHREKLQRALLGSTCFLATALFAFAIKGVAVGLAWDWHEVVGAGHKLASWTGLEMLDMAPQNATALASHGLSPETVKSSRLLAVLFAFAKMAYLSDLLGYGSKVLGAAVVSGGLVLLPVTAACFAYRVRSPDGYTRSALLLSAWFVIVAWHFVFVRHSIVHAHFMSRPQVWLTALAVGGFVWLSIALKRSLRHE